MAEPAGDLGDRHARRLEEAISAHQDAVAIFRETADRYWEGIALDNLEKYRAAQALSSERQ